ncbi:MAG: DUF58 domain-containing protein [Pseudomonadota bacterium]
MISKDLLKKIKQIQIKTDYLVDNAMVGHFKSAFKGKGMEFEEVREYQVGDDVKNIDWNMTAKTGFPHIKEFREERELTIIIMVDVSSSNYFGTSKKFKNELAAELSAFLAYSSIKNNDKVGLLLFSDVIEKFIPPRKGKSHIFRLIKEIISFKPRSSGTNISMALEYLIHLIKKRSVAFLISDFHDKDFENLLSLASKKHDLIAFNIYDKIERALPKASLISFYDLENGEEQLVDSSNKKFREDYEKTAGKNIFFIKSIFQKLKVDFISLKTDEDFVDPLVKFFKQREKRIRI